MDCMCCVASRSSVCRPFPWQTRSLPFLAACLHMPRPRLNLLLCSSLPTRPWFPRASPPVSPSLLIMSLSSTCLPCSTTPHPQTWPISPPPTPSLSPISCFLAMAAPSCLSPTMLRSPKYSPCSPPPGSTISGEAGLPASSMMSVFLQMPGGWPWAPRTGLSIFFLSILSVAHPMFTAI